MAPRTIIYPELLGTSAQVTVVQYENPGNFWVAMTKNDSVLHSLQERMQSYCRESSHTTQSWHVGDFCSAQSTFDSVWYRAVVTAEPVNSICAVFLVDFGRAERLPLNRLRLLKPEFFDVPRLAAWCSLQSIRPPDHSRSVWSSKSIQSCRDMLAVAYPLQCQFTKKLPQSTKLDGMFCYEVVVIDKDRSLNPAVQLVQNGLAWLNIGEQRLGEPTCFLDMVKKVYPVVDLTNTSCEVMFSTFRTLSDFYVQQTARSDELLMLKNRISQDVSKTMIMTSPSVEIGGACLAPFNDSKYYRAIFLDCSLESCQVFYVDYGNTASVVRSSCLPVLNHLRVENIFAHKCSLQGVRVVEGRDHRESVIIADRIQAEIHKLNSSSAYCTFHGQKQGVYDVTIFCGSQNFAEHLQSLGLVHYSGTTQSPLSNRVTKSPRHESLRGLGGCINHRFINPTLKIQPGMYEAVTVVAVKSPQEFYVWLSKIAAENRGLGNSLNAFYSQMAMSPVDVKALTLSCAVVVRWQRRFYRASVREICESHITARLVDYGHVVKVSPQDVFECVPEFLVPLSQAIACSLHGFDELSVPDRINKRMEDLCLERQHFTKILGINDRQFVEVVLFLSNNQGNYINVNDLLMQAIREDTSRRPQSLPSDELRRMNHLTIGEHRNLPSSRNSSDFERAGPNHYREEVPFRSTSAREGVNCRGVSFDALESPDGSVADDSKGSSDSRRLSSPAFVDNRRDDPLPPPVQRRGRGGFRGNSRMNSYMVSNRHSSERGWSPDNVNQSTYVGDEGTDSQPGCVPRRPRRSRGLGRLQVGRGAIVRGSRPVRSWSNDIREDGSATSQNGWTPDELSVTSDYVGNEHSAVQFEGRDRRSYGRGFGQQSRRGIERSLHAHHRPEDVRTSPRPSRFNDQSGRRTLGYEESQPSGRYGSSSGPYEDAQPAFRWRRGTDRGGARGMDSSYRGFGECAPSSSRGGRRGWHEEDQTPRTSRGSRGLGDGRGRGRGSYVSSTENARDWSVETKTVPTDKMEDGWEEESSQKESYCVDSDVESFSKASVLPATSISETTESSCSKRSVLFDVVKLMSGSKIEIRLHSIDDDEDAVDQFVIEHESRVDSNCPQSYEQSPKDRSRLRVNFVGLPDVPFLRESVLMTRTRFHGELDPSGTRLSCEELKEYLIANRFIDGYEVCSLPFLPIPDEAVGVSVLPNAYNLHVRLHSMLTEQTELELELSVISTLAAEQRPWVPIRPGVYAVMHAEDEPPKRVLLISIAEQDNSATVFCIDEGHYQFDVPLSCLGGLTAKLWQIPPLAVRCSYPGFDGDDAAATRALEEKKVKFKTKYPPYLLDEDYSDVDVSEMPFALIWPGNLCYAFNGPNNQIVIRVAGAALEFEPDDCFADTPPKLAVVLVGDKWYRAERSGSVDGLYDLVDMGIFGVDESSFEEIRPMPKRYVPYPKMAQIVKVQAPDKVIAGQLYAVEIVEFIQLTAKLHLRPVPCEILEILDNGHFVLDNEFCQTYEDLLYLLPDSQVAKSTRLLQLCRQVLVGCTYEEPLISDCIEYLEVLDETMGVESIGDGVVRLSDRMSALVAKHCICEADNTDEVFAIANRRLRLTDDDEVVDIDTGEVVVIGGRRYRLPQPVIRIPPLIELRTSQCVHSLLEDIVATLSE